MTRRAARVDANQAEIVRVLRACGCPVRVMSDVGRGFPDLLVGRRGVFVLFEVKDGEKPPSKRRLTKDEQRFFDDWAGYPRYKVESVDDALAVVGVEAHGAAGAKR